MPRPGYADMPGMPGRNTANINLIMALKLVRRYGDRIPTVKQLMNDFPVHRSTAWRWHNALAESLRTEE